MVIAFQKKGTVIGKVALKPLLLLVPGWELQHFTKINPKTILAKTKSVDDEEQRAAVTAWLRVMRTKSMNLSRQRHL
jgi:hypothetical protein